MRRGVFLTRISRIYRMQWGLCAVFFLTRISRIYRMQWGSRAVFFFHGLKLTISWLETHNFMAWNSQFHGLKLTISRLETRCEYRRIRPFQRWGMYRTLLCKVWVGSLYSEERQCTARCLWACGSAKNRCLYLIYNRCFLLGIILQWGRTPECRWATRPQATCGTLLFNENLPE